MTFKMKKVRLNGVSEFRLQTWNDRFASLKRIIGQNWPLILFGLAHILIFLVIFQGFFFGYASKDNSIGEYTYALQMHFGQWPYRDFAVEYPPLSMLFIFLPTLIAQAYNSYLGVYITEMLIFDLLGIVIINALAKEMRLNRWKTLAVYTLILLAVGPIITVRFDIIPAVITLLSLYALIKGHPKLAWALLAVGFFTKIYPAILAPLFLIYQLRYKQNRQIITGLASFIVTSLVVLVPSLILSPSGLWHSLDYHMQRGLQIESTYASIMELLQAFKLISMSFIRNFGSINLVSPLANFFAKISFGVMFAGLLAVYGFFFKGLRNIPAERPDYPDSMPDRALLLNFSALAILTFLVTSKVFSSQYLIWLLPLMPFLSGKWKVLSWLIFIMAGLMSFFIYPEYYIGITHGMLPVIIMLVLRNMALTAMAFLIAGSRSMGKLIPR